MWRQLAFHLNGPFGILFFFCAPCSLPPFCCFNLRWKHNHALHTSISSCCELSFPAVTRADQCPSIPTARADSTRTEWMAHANDNKSGTSSNQNTVLHLFVVRSGSFLNATERCLIVCTRGTWNVGVYVTEREGKWDRQGTHNNQFPTGRHSELKEEWERKLCV